LLGNRHVQTLLGNAFLGSPILVPAREHCLPLADGDLIVWHDHRPLRWRPGDLVVVLVHGLGGSHRSGHVQRLAGLLLGRGARAICLDLRGCGKGLPLARRAYHAGRSDDLRAVATEIARQCPGSPLALVGFSLGGNIVLKLGGELADFPVPQLRQLVAVAPPVQLESSAELLAQPQNRFYELHFLRDLIEQARRRHRYFADTPLPRFSQRMTIRLFDDIYTAPRNGFVDAIDYYRRCSSLPLLPKIGVPTLILAARDDPFVTVVPLATADVPSHVDVQIANQGGHIGFLGWDGAGGIRWAERRIADWLLPST
jgi:predicted alpha/beta-fold hydrolase